jgi:uncharacterized protein YlxW (UPF0749 family)
MDKRKLSGLVIAGMIGFLSISPVTTFAAETNTESVTQTDTNKVRQDRKTVFREKMKKASEKWNSLTSQQKQEVYSLMEEDMDLENQLMDKLAELQIIEKQDAEMIKSHMKNRYDKVKESGEFPFMRQKSHRKNN